MIKKLPICFDPEIKFECWTYFRTSIIRAYKEFDDWFIHHLNNLYITSEFDCDFGKVGRKYNIVSHYDEILDFEEKLYFHFTYLNIIDEMCNYIDNNKYIVMDIDCSKIYNYVESTFITQFLFYGYDKNKKVFFTPSIRGGFWHEVEVEWDKIIQAFNVRKKFTKKEIVPITGRQNPFPMLVIKPKTDVIPSVHLSKFYNDIKIAWALADTVYRMEGKNISFQEGVLGVYNGLAELTQLVYDDKFVIDNLGYDHGFLSGFCKTLEYNIMLRKTLRRVDKMFSLNFSDEIYLRMNEIVGTNEKLKNMVIKFITDRKKEQLLKIIIQLKQLKTAEKELFISILTFTEEQFYIGYENE